MQKHIQYFLLVVIDVKSGYKWEQTFKSMEYKKKNWNGKAAKEE